MNRQISLRKNFIMNGILTMSSIVFPLISFPYVSRVLLPLGVGKVGFATSIISYFSLFAQLGIPTYGIRACAKVRDDKYELSKVVHELFIINALVMLLTYLVFIPSVLLIPRLSEEKNLMLIVSLMIFFNCVGVEWLYRGLEQYTYITIRSVVFKFIALVAMLLLVRNTNDYIIYGAISIFASSASNILNLINAKKYVLIRNLGGYRFRRHLKPIFVFFAMSCATTIYTHLDTVMLGFICGDEEVGYYQTAVKVKGILISLITSLGAVLLPRASYYVENKMMDGFFSISKKALEFVLVVATPLMVFFVCFADDTIIFLAGSSFALSISPMRIIMPTILLIGLTNVMGIQMLVPLGREKSVLYSEIAGAIINLILNAILIPQYGSAGAAIGTLVAEFMVLLVQYYYLRDSFADLINYKSCFSIGIGVVIALASSIWIKLFISILFFRLALSSICFFGIYTIILYLQKEPTVVDVVCRINSMVCRIVHR